MALNVSLVPAGLQPRDPEIATGSIKLRHSSLWSLLSVVRISLQIVLLANLHF